MYFLLLYIILFIFKWIIQFYQQLYSYILTFLIAWLSFFCGFFCALSHNLVVQKVCAWVWKNIRGEKRGRGRIRSLGIFIVLVHLRIQLIKQINLGVGLHCRQFKLLCLHWSLRFAWLSITDLERVKLRYCTRKNLSEGCARHRAMPSVSMPKGSR